MHSIKWFVEKAKKLVQVYKNYRSNMQIEKWYSTLTDEELRQWIIPATEDLVSEERGYRQPLDLAEELHKVEEHQALAEVKYMEEFEAEALKQKRAEEARDQELVDEWQCQDCGGSVSTCTCTPDDDKSEIPQMGLPGHEEEEIPLWLEHANEKCPNCGLLPEFCQCQYEE